MQATQCLQGAVTAVFLQRGWVLPDNEGDWDYKVNTSSRGVPAWVVDLRVPLPRFLRGEAMYLSRALTAEDQQVRVPNAQAYIMSSPHNARRSRLPTSGAEGLAYSDGRCWAWPLRACTRC